MNGFRNLWRALRLGWVSLVMAFGGFWIWKQSAGDGMLMQQASVLAWKCIVVTTGVMLAHLTQKQLFGYIDVNEIVSHDDSRSGLIFLGLSLFYAAVILALSTGL